LGLMSFSDMNILNFYIEILSLTNVFTEY
jgi:hypothetical protein